MDNGELNPQAPMAKQVFHHPGEALDAYTELREHPGWRHFMYRAAKEALAIRRKWNETTVTPEELADRNTEMTKASAILGLIQQLNQRIEELKDTVEGT